MEQRSLRLGDIVDDYCPRERRLTNHVIVALIGDAIRQTRCTACEAEHEYKEAREPKKKPRPANGDSGNGLAGGVLVVPRAAASPAPVTPAADPADTSAEASEPPAPPAPAAADAAPESAPTVEPAHDGWMAHRRLIRATLPRVEGAEPQPRPIPEFTMHQRQGRGGPGGGRGFRPFGGHGGQGGNGNGPFRDGNGPDGNRPPHGGGKGRRRRRRR